MTGIGGECDRSCHRSQDLLGQPQGVPHAQETTSTKLFFIRRRTEVISQVGDQTLDGGHGRVVDVSVGESALEHHAGLLWFPDPGERGGRLTIGS